MPISYDEALKAQKAIEDILLNDPNIVSVGVIKNTNDFGEKTGNYAIKVGVISTAVYQHAIEHGQSIVPHVYRLYDENNPQEVKHVHIKVVKVGEIKPLFMEHSNFVDKDSKRNMKLLVDHISHRRSGPYGQIVGNYSIFTTPARTLSHRTNMQADIPRPRPLPMTRPFLGLATRGTSNAMKISTSLPPIAKCAALLAGLGTYACKLKKVQPVTKIPDRILLEKKLHGENHYKPQ